MTEYINESTILRLDCDNCPIAPGLRFDRLDIEVLVTIEKTSESVSNVWEQGSSDDGSEIELSHTDERVQLSRPRIVKVRLPVGEPPEAGTYELFVDLSYNNETVRWPSEPRQIEFSHN